MDHSPGFLRVAEAARAKIREISIPEVHAQLDQAGTAYELVDVREDGEFQAGHLPGARHLGRGVLERDVEKAIPDPARPIIVYCGGGYRSALAAESLANMGYTNVRSMAGGFRGWTDAGLGVVTDVT
jgi:rhodanese-related sulfurtransferase